MVDTYSVRGFEFKKNLRQCADGEKLVLKMLTTTINLQIGERLVSSWLPKLLAVKFRKVIVLRLNPEERKWIMDGFLLRICYSITRSDLKLEFGPPVDDIIRVRL